MRCQIKVSHYKPSSSWLFPSEDEFQSRSLCLEKEEEWLQTSINANETKLFQGGTEDRCLHLPRTIVLEAMQSSAPSNGAAPEAVATRWLMVTIPNFRKTKYYHCQLSVNFLIANYITSCPSRGFLRFQVLHRQIWKLTSGKPAS